MVEPALQPFLIDTPSTGGSGAVLPAIEQRLVLAEPRPGMLADDLSGYLFARSTGHIGSLMTLINRGCQRAARTDAERLDQAGARRHEERRRGKAG